MRRILLVLAVVALIATFAAPATANPAACVIDCESVDSVETTTGN